MLKRRLPLPLLSRHKPRYLAPAAAAQGRGPGRRGPVLSVGQGQRPSMIAHTGRDPKLPTFPAHSLGDDDQKRDQILRIQHKVFFAHNVTQCPSEEVAPESTWDKGGVVSGKTHGGHRPRYTPTHGGGAAGRNCGGSGGPLGRAEAWGSVCPQLCVSVAGTAAAGRDSGAVTCHLRGC